METKSDWPATKVEVRSGIEELEKIFIFKSSMLSGCIRVHYYGAKSTNWEQWMVEFNRSPVTGKFDPLELENFEMVMDYINNGEF